MEPHTPAPPPPGTPATYPGMPAQAIDELESTLPLALKRLFPDLFPRFIHV